MDWTGIASYPPADCAINAGGKKHIEKFFRG